MKRFLVLPLLALPLAGCPQTQTSSGKTSATPDASASAAPDTGGPQPPGKPRRGELPTLANALIPAGEFVMGSEGSTKGGLDIERPRAKRQVAAFTIDLCEVTNAAYAKFLASPDCDEHTFCHPEEPSGKNHRPGPPSAQERAWGSVPDPFADPARAQHPVVGVDWFDAYAFASWVGRRLPSEDEWERAARGPGGRTWPWGETPVKEGDTIRAAARFARPGMTAPVGSLPAGDSLEGVHDLAGNVWEWTASPFVPYEGAPQDTPSNPDHLVIRGGGWTSASAFLLRSAMRHDQPRRYRSAALGFRTVGAPDDRRGAQ